MSELIAPLSRYVASRKDDLPLISDDVIEQYAQKAINIDVDAPESRAHAPTKVLDSLRLRGTADFLSGGGRSEVAAGDAVHRGSDIDVDQPKVATGGKIFVLNGTSEQCTVLRRQHEFSGIPRVSLCKNILGLCKHSKAGARAAVQFADALAGDVLEMASRDGGASLESAETGGTIVRLVSGISELLLEAIRLYNSDGELSDVEREAFLAECDLLLSSARLLQDLVINSTDSPGRPVAWNESVLSVSRIGSRPSSLSASSGQRVLSRAREPDTPLVWLATAVAATTSADIVALGLRSSGSQSRFEAESKQLHAARHLRRLRDSRVASQLRDRLLEADQVALADRVCEATGVDNSAVHISWGISLLRFGKYSEAKERLETVLVEASEGDTSGQKDVLNEIVRALEEPVLSDHFALRSEFSDLSRDHRAQRGAFQPNADEDDMSLESFLGVFGSSSSARNLSAQAKSEKQYLPESLDDVRTMQCVYYLKRFGSSDSVCEFLLRHRLYKDVVGYVFFGVGSAQRQSSRGENEPAESAAQQKVQRSIFINQVFAHCIAHGELAELREAIASVDPGMKHGSTRFCLGSLCAMLNQRGAYEILLDFLVLMGDHARAALACVKLFRERHSAVPSEKVAFLESARDHLLRALESLASVQAHVDQEEPQQRASEQSIDDLVAAAAAAVVKAPTGDDNTPSAQAAQSGETSALSETEVTKYLQSVALQLQVAQLAQPLLPAGVPVGGGTNFEGFAIQHEQQSQQYADPDALPTVGDLMGRVTLFGGSTQRLAVAVAAIVYLNRFNLAFQIVQDFRLPCEEGEVYRRAARHLTRKRQLGKVNDMLKNVKGTIDDSEWDRVIESGVIAVLCEELGDTRGGEKYIGRLTGAPARVRANITCRKLRAAYLLAVKLNSVELVAEIRTAAKLHDAKVFKLCETFIGEATGGVVRH
jgi:hypothetical protein